MQPCRCVIICPVLSIEAVPSDISSLRAGTRQKVAFSGDLKGSNKREMLRRGSFCVWCSCVSATSVYSQRKKCLNLQEARLQTRTVCLHLARSCRQVLLAGFVAPFFFFLSLFAQRLGAIIGANTPHCLYLCTHAGAQKTSACKCAPQADTHVRGCTAPACTAAANTQSLPLPSASSLCLSLSGGPWPPTAGSSGGGGGVSERCDSAGKVQDNKSVSRSVSAPFLPSIYQISSCNLP